MGPEQCFTYTVLDQTGQAITNNLSNLTVTESLTYKSGAKPLPSAWGPVGLQTGGIFGDQQAFFSKTGPVPSSYKLDFLQALTITNTVTKETWTPRLNCIKWAGPTSITVTDVTSNPSSCT